MGDYKFRDELLDAAWQEFVNSSPFAHDFTNSMLIHNEVCIVDGKVVDPNRVKEPTVLICFGEHLETARKIMDATDPPTAQSARK